jgi:hypothetical protein
MHFVPTLLLTALCSAVALGQNEEPKPPHPLPPHGEGKGGYFTMRDRHMSFDRLSDEEKKKVRAALDAAWSKPEMKEAKERLSKANEEFRATLRTVLSGIDPEAVALLEKMAPEPPPFEPPPRPEVENFAQLSLDRLGNEMKHFAKPERKDAMGELHLKLLENAELVPLVAALKAAPVSERVRAFEQVKQKYRALAWKYFGDLRRDREAKGKGPEPKQ